MKELKYFQIIQELKKLKAESSTPILKIRILSNVIVHQLVDILDFYLREQQLECEIILGNYDNIVQDATEIPKDEVVIIFWEACNIVDGFYYMVKTMNSSKKQEHLQKVKDELSLVFFTLQKQKKVFINSFHSMPFENEINPGCLQLFVKDLNSWIKKSLPTNFYLFDLSSVFFKIGFNQAFDLRNYFSSKALYSIEFFKIYSTLLTPMIAAITGRIKKVLIVDCDNTLWKGIIGEDGKEGIQLTDPYRIIQTAIVQLYHKGVLICICSKNNPEDVEEIFDSHPRMILKNEHIILKKINWEDKAANIQAISEELNLGLSSFVFLDDSLFESELIKKALPEVKVYVVPEKNYEYPALMEEITHEFFRYAISEDDLSKTEQYRQQTLRANIKSSFSSIDDYLRSLDLQIHLEKNNRNQISRISQMSQKTNQFNLTTKRYTEQDIENMMSSSNYDIFTLAVSDKFGDSGITGLAIIKNDGNKSYIDTFLLSCRILGRNIEWIFFDEMVNQIKSPLLYGQFIPSKKNMQVNQFFKNLGFKELRKDKESTIYWIEKSNYKAHTNIDYIKVNIWKPE